VAEGWRRLYNEESHNLYASLNIIRVGGACSMYGRNEKCTQNMGQETLEEETC
jgi:hypothetical protein